MAKMRISRRSLLMFTGLAINNMDDTEFSRFSTIVGCSLGLCDIEGNALNGIEEPYPKITDELLDSIRDEEVREFLRGLRIESD